MKQPTAKQFIMDITLFMVVAVVMTWVWLDILPLLNRIWYTDLKV